MAQRTFAHSGTLDLSPHSFGRAQNVPSCRMAHGRLIRIIKSSGDAAGVTYIVAIADSAAAKALIEARVADPEDGIEDLGRVSAALLAALGLTDGDYTRADQPRLPKVIENGPAK
jgi:hypothetical protein